MQDLALLPVKERLKKALIGLQKQFGQDEDGYVDLRIPRLDLAQYVGTTYETLFRTLNEMQEQGSVMLDGKRIKLIQLS